MHFERDYDDHLIVGTVAHGWDVERGHNKFGNQSQSHNAVMYIDFGLLTTFFITRMSSPSTLLMLYTFLHSHPTFLPYLVASKKAQALLVALLRAMYKTIHALSLACRNNKNSNDSIPSSVYSSLPSPESMYLIVINTLLIIQDVTLRPLMSKLMTEEDISWYMERKLGEVRHFYGTALSL